MRYYLQSLEWELAHAPRCGLCSFFPIDTGIDYYCPILERSVHRRTTPPKLPGKFIRYYCFYPMTKLAYEQLRKFTHQRDNLHHRRFSKGYIPHAELSDEDRERVNKAQRERREINPTKHREEVKRWRMDNPDKANAITARYHERHRAEIRERNHRKYLETKDTVKERSIFRSYIYYYNPMRLVNRRFQHAKYIEQQGTKSKTMTNP